MVKEVWGLRPSKWLVLPSWGASEDILMVWDVNRVEVLDHEIGAFSIAIRCRLKLSLVKWVYVGVYGPVLGVEVDSFLRELDDMKARWDLLWCIDRDFNLVRFPSERNDGRRWDSTMRKFGAFIDRWHLLDGPLKGAQFTWSNFQSPVSMSKLDRFLFYGDWDDVFPDRSRVAIPRVTSYHYPIMLERKLLLGGPFPLQVQRVVVP